MIFLRQNGLTVQIVGISRREYEALADAIQPDKTIQIADSHALNEPAPRRIKKRHYVRKKGVA